jgi:tetratricopeptide (TPR) repeat protein
MVLRFAHTLSDRDPLGAARAATGFHRKYQTARDSLPQSDADRAFHLVAQAADLIDYQLPFATDEALEPMMQSASKMLGEALELDEHCHDARRMKAAAEAPTFDTYYRFLADGAEEVRAYCTAEADQARRGHLQPELSAHLALRPYLRWVSCTASKALVCGRYRRAAELCEELLRLDPQDMADARFTWALALAKLEDADGLERLATEYPPAAFGRRHEDAWWLIARAALAFKRHELAEGRSYVARLVSLYPHAGETLMRQDEYPDGVYARLAARPDSEDELIIAVSEATVLLQEGLEEVPGSSLWTAPPPEKHLGSYGAWLQGSAEVRRDAERSARTRARYQPRGQNQSGEGGGA